MWACGAGTAPFSFVSGAAAGTGAAHSVCSLRAAWLHYISEEVRGAIRAGVPMEGMCLYPVLGHMGWDEDRYCPNGLFELEPRQGCRRPVHAPLAQELRRQQAEFAALFPAAAAAA